MHCRGHVIACVLLLGAAGCGRFGFGAEGGGDAGPGGDGGIVMDGSVRVGNIEIEVVGSDVCGSGDLVVSVDAVAPRPGDLILVVMSMRDQGGTPTVSDSVGGNYTAIGLASTEVQERAEVRVWSALALEEYPVGATISVAGAVANSRSAVALVARGGGTALLSDFGDGSASTRAVSTSPVALSPGLGLAFLGVSNLPGSTHDASWERLVRANADCGGAVARSYTEVAVAEIAAPSVLGYSGRITNSTAWAALAGGLAPQ